MIHLRRHITFPLYLKDLGMGHDLTFETLVTKEFEKVTVAKRKE